MAQLGPHRYGRVAIRPVRLARQAHRLGSTMGEGLPFGVGAGSIDRWWDRRCLPVWPNQPSIDGVGAALLPRKELVACSFYSVCITPRHEGRFGHKGRLLIWS